MPRRVAANWRMLFKLAVVCVAMFAFGYALVPLYRALCTALGINVLAVTEQVNAPALGNTQVDMSRTVTVVFDANARGPWRFRPKTPTLQLHPGQMQTVIYEIWNPTGRTMRAQSIPSYAPMNAAAHFHKLQCFCFKEQTLKAGERREFPVTFIVDDKLPKDVGTITLSYTFFEVGAATPAAPAGNGI
ncbi:MAG: cytochrome c oxidase assembly protein [Betaproteobacteria bacterium]|nr:cytochrome c oxidase assembly protein [Betaproteobacteria bacterium]